jgi:hypothetical protein
MGSLNCKACKCQAENEIIARAETEGITEVSENLGPSPEEIKKHHIEDLRHSLQNDVNLHFGYKSESKWDLIFNLDDNKEATVNGLFNLRKRVIEYYDDFLGGLDIQPAKIKLYKKDLDGLNNRDVFLKDMRQLVLKNLLVYFKIHGLDKKLKDVNIELSNEENLETYNSLFNKKGLQAPSQTPNLLTVPKETPVVVSLSLESERAYSIETTKANTKMTETDRKGILSGVADMFRNFGSSKKVVIDIVEDEAKRLSDEMKMHEIIKKSTFEKRAEMKRSTEKISISSSMKHTDSDNENCISKKKVKKTLIRAKDTYEIVRIQNHYEKDEDNLIFISFKDKRTGMFYEGYWHVYKNCKYGLGVEYSFGSDRYKYFGYFRDGKYHGLGILLREHNYSYFGEFREGHYAGYGVEKGRTFTYSGFFKDDKYCGFGDYTYLKSSYIGCYYNGLKEGIGFSTFEDGCTYLGIYKDNLMHGIGLYRWPEGHYYYGPWKDDRKSGVGFHRWSSGHTYIGGYKNDLKDGNGQYTFFNGCKLIGTWINGKKENVFELVDKYKRKYELVYKNDIQMEN